MNSEHYQDPTAEKAISRVEKKRQEKRKNRRYRYTPDAVEAGAGRNRNHLRIQGAHYVHRKQGEVMIISKIHVRSNVVRIGYSKTKKKCRGNMY